MNKWTGELQQRSLSQALALPADDGLFFAWRDTVTGLEYLRRARGLQDHGIAVDLRGYQYIVLLHWRELRSSGEQPWDQLCDGLNGAGVHSLDEALTRLRLRPLTGALRDAVAWDGVRLLSPSGEHAMSETEAARAWGDRAKAVYERWADLQSSDIRDAQGYATVATTLGVKSVQAVADARLARALPPHTHAEALWSPLMAVAALRALPAEENVVDALQLRPALAEIFSEVGIQGEDAWRAAARVRMALNPVQIHAAAFWAEGDVHWLAAVNEHHGVRYVNREALEQLLHWLTIAEAVQPAGSSASGLPAMKVLDAAEAAQYRFDDMCIRW